MDIPTNQKVPEGYDSLSRSYFDLPRRSDGGTSLSPSTEATKLTGIDPPARRSIGRQTRSDYSTALHRVHVQAIEEDLPDSLPAIHVDSSNTPPTLNADVESISTRGSTEPHYNDTAHPLKEAPDAPQSRTQNKYLPLAKNKQAYPPRLPRLGHMWARTQSGSVWFESQKTAIERQGRSSSSNNNSQTSISEQLPVRTLQSPLRPPPPSRHSSSHVASGLSNMKVETPFSESSPSRVSNMGDTDSYGFQTEASDGSLRSRQSSKKPRTIISTSLSVIRRMSGPKVAPKITISHASDQRSEVKPDSLTDPGLSDHSSLLKRNYTSDALARVTAILQDAKQNSTGSG